MTTKILALVATALLACLAGCRKQETPTDAGKTPTVPPAQSTTPANTQVYTCPMHPEVVSSTPGKCPKCDMDLVLKQ